MFRIFNALLNTDVTFMHFFDLFVEHYGQPVIQRYALFLPHLLFESIKFCVANT